MQIFGPDVIDALVNQQCLIVLHSSGFVRLYSLVHIMSKASVVYIVILLYSLVHILSKASVVKCCVHCASTIRFSL